MRPQAIDVQPEAPGPIRVRGRSRDIEAIFQAEKIRDHDGRDPGIAPEKGRHDRGVKVAVEVCFCGEMMKSGELGNLPDLASGLICGRGLFLESFFPEGADRFVVVRRIRGDGEAFVVLTADDRFRAESPTAEF